VPVYLANSLEQICNPDWKDVTHWNATINLWTKARFLLSTWFS